MTITPEQFNELLRENLKDFVTKDEHRKGINEILGAVDGIRKKLGDYETEHEANLAAHDRIQTDINDCVSMSA